MSRKGETGLKVHVTSKGAIRYADANELLQQPRVRKFLQDMKGIEEKSKASQ